MIELPKRRETCRLLDLAADAAVCDHLRLTTLSRGVRGMTGIHLAAGSLERRQHGRISDFGYERLPVSALTHLLSDVLGIGLG